MTIKDVARDAQVCENFVRKEIRSERLGHTRLGDAIRIRVDQYNDWIRRQTIDPQF